MTHLLDIMALDSLVVEPSISNSSPERSQQPTMLIRVDPLTLPDTISAIEHVLLPGFWRHSPQQWFTHAEAIFHTNRVKSDLTRINHVLATLDEEGIQKVSHILGSNVQYSAVRNRLVTAYAIP